MASEATERVVTATKLLSYMEEEVKKAGNWLYDAACAQHSSEETH